MTHFRQSTCHCGSQIYETVYAGISFLHWSSEKDGVVELFLCLFYRNDENSNF